MKAECRQIPQKRAARLKFLWCQCSDQHTFKFQRSVRGHLPASLPVCRLYMLVTVHFQSKDTIVHYLSVSTEHSNHVTESNMFGYVPLQLSQESTLI